MCTSIVVETTKNRFNLARTMDFGVELNPELIAIPRNYNWSPTLAANEPCATPNGFLGAARLFDSEYIFADGVNEHGLCCCSLFFPGYAKYSDAASKGKTNLAPHEFVYWALANFDTVDSVKAAVKNLNLVGEKTKMFDMVLPLHWVLMDRAGNSVIVESTTKGIEVHDNVTGVMSNSPDYQWHVTNLRNYAEARPMDVDKLEINGIELKPFSAGRCMVGIPGDFTPPSRFVRAFFAKGTMPSITSRELGVYEIFQVLSTVNVPKGAEVTLQNVINYTQYTGCMSSFDCTYYITTYYGFQLRAVRLTDDLLSAATPTHYAVQNNGSDVSFL